MHCFAKLARSSLQSNEESQKKLLSSNSCLSLDSRSVITMERRASPAAFLICFADLLYSFKIHLKSTCRFEIDWVSAFVDQDSGCLTFFLAKQYGIFFATRSSTEALARLLVALCLISISR